MTWQLGPGEVLDQVLASGIEAESEVVIEGIPNASRMRAIPVRHNGRIVAVLTREWSELGDSGYTLEEKAEQVLQQLKAKRARIVFDCTSETWNIIPCR